MPFHPRNCELRHLFALLVCLLPASAPRAQFQITLTPSRDTTLFEEGDLSNGGGQYLFAGRIASNPRRRALLAFDLSPIPPNSVILDAELTLTMSRTISGGQDISLHRVTADWVEGTAMAAGQEGGGAPANAGDSTWNHRQFSSLPWTSPGGDFSSFASASTVVADLGSYQWSGPGLAADVQSWVNAPGTHFGWLIMADEGSGAGSAKRFNSRENATGAPSLVVTFAVGMPLSAQAVPTLSGAGLAALALLLAGVAARRVRGQS